MIVSELDDMSTKTHLSKNSGEIKAVSSLTDLDFSIGELAVSHIPYESSSMRVDESSATMFTSDVSAADGLLSAFDSISFAEGAAQRNDRAKNTIQIDAIGAVCEAGLPGMRTVEGQDTSTFGYFDFAEKAKPSINGDGETDAVDENDETRKSNDHLIVYTSSRRNTTRITNTRLNQKNDSQRSSGNCRMFAQKDSDSDLKSLQISRRRRSLFSKRARSSVWRFVGLPASEEHSVLDPNSENGKKLGRARGGQGKKNSIRDQKGSKSVRKSSAPTRHITLKIKIGNQSCGVVNVGEKFNVSGESIPCSRDGMENKNGKVLPGDVLLPNENNLEKLMFSDSSVLSTHLNVTSNLENKSFSTISDLRKIINHEEVDSLRASTENRCSDPGTSPDSEVINSVPDAPLYEKGLQDTQDSQVMSMENSRLECFTNSVPDVSFVGVSSLSLPQVKSIKGKKKDKHYQFGHCGLENKITGGETKHNAKAPMELEPRQKMANVSKCGDAFVISTANPFLNTYSCNRVSSGSAGFSRMTSSGTPSTTLKQVHIGAEGNPSSGYADGTESTKPQPFNSFIPCCNGQKSPKYSGTKGGNKSRSGVLNLPSKKGKDYRKKKDKNDSVVKHQIDEKDDTSVLPSGVGSRKAVASASGNQTSSDLGKTGDLSKGSSSLKNCLPLSSGGLKEQSAQPRNAWVLCDECQKWRRILATLADHIEETNCRWTCKNNTDKDFADCSIPQEKSNSEINEELEISDASCDEDARDTFLKSKENQLNADKPLSWSLIKSNLFLHRSRKTQTIDEVMVCHCKPPSDGRMGCGAKCLNRMLNIECVKGTCPCGELCSNQQFQKRIYAKLKWFKCGRKGFGLQALQGISEGQFVIEYVGEVLDIHAYDARQRDYALQGHRHFYFMTLNGSEVIDACAKGNLGRFINHSCDPNCRTEKWMVNGEVCVGLFAIREIKKGEELTFDYNYVRVFGAAAKKCVCGSPNCRGYIGGDPTNSDVIVQGDSDDEYAEPVMICEDREMNDEWNDIMSHLLYDRENESANELLQEDRYRMKKANSDGQFESITDSLNHKLGVNSTSADDGCTKTSTATRVADMTVRDESQPDNSVDINTTSSAAVGSSDNNKDIGESLNCSSSATLKVQSEGILHQILSPVKRDVSFQPEGVMSSTMPSAVHFSHGLEMSTTSILSKSRPDTIESKRKLKYSTMGGKEELSKSNSLTKTHRSSSLIKKEKLKYNVPNDKGTPYVDKSNGAPHKSRKLPDLSLNTQIEAVEEKLNELLDTERGISKRKDASRGYLKLLFLTAASGTNGHGEAIQSNRDLSMILDALLKTKSRTVLVDIINKNGVQMLHNIMKRYRKEFIKTPILRKLLRVLEYLAMREILTLEHITGGPPCPGVESFKDSILSLTEHADKQVHQIARNFRDRWIPRSLRKSCFMETDDAKPHQGSSYGKLSVSSGDHWVDRGGKPSESVECCNTQTVETSTMDNSSALGCDYGNNGRIITRKRKSRWDNPVEECMHPSIKASFSGDKKPNIDQDAPPGFSSPCRETMVLSSNGRAPSTKHPFDIVLADTQERFNARVPLSYGVPFSVIQQCGVREAEAAAVWTVAPGLPFHPFPPLPPCADKCTSLSEPVEKAEQDDGTSVAPHSGQKRKTTCSLDAPEMDRNEPLDNLGKKFFRQQKWNHSKLAPPWVRMRNGWGPMGNARNSVHGDGFADGMNQFRNPYASEAFEWGGEF